VGVNVNKVDATGRAAAHVAASEGLTNCLGQYSNSTWRQLRLMISPELLMKAGANLDLRDSFKRTPLHCAADAGQIECIKTMLTQKEHVSSIANPNAKGTKQIVNRVRMDGKRMLIGLLSLGFDGMVPLHAAAENKQNGSIEVKQVSL